MDLGRFRLAKQPSARHTLALVGWSAVAKDPTWALEVLCRLRSHDDRYRLLLVGSPLDPAPSRAATAARAAFDARLSADDVAGAVEQTGQVDDVPGVLARVGVVLSASVRESFHQAVAEGAASGAVPVVRNWPMYSAYGGARAVFPADWVVDDVDGAVERILATSSDEQRWHAEGAAASAAAAERFDWGRVAPRYDALLGVGS
jgi:glycosyltransferase involved in cell wall biosynthesis